MNQEILNLNKGKMSRRQFISRTASATAGVPLLPFEGILTPTSAKQRKQESENGVGDYCEILFQFGVIMLSLAAAERLIDESGSQKRNG